LDRLDVAAANRINFLRPKFRQDDIVEHCAIVADALGAGDNEIVAGNRKFESISLQQ
jgi:hypothetical protein